MLDSVHPPIEPSVDVILPLTDAVVREALVSFAPIERKIPVYSIEKDADVGSSPVQTT